MTNKELKKLNRSQLLELLVDQSREIDRLQTALDEANQKLAKRDLMMSQCGSIADASLALSDVFEKAQEAADLYLKAAKRYVARMIAEGKPLPTLLSDSKPEDTDK